MNKWKQEGQLKKYSSSSSVITHIIKYQERFFHFTSHLAFVGDTTFPNTDSDESTTLENEEKQLSPTTRSDQDISVKRNTLLLGVKRSNQAREKRHCHNDAYIFYHIKCINRVRLRRRNVIANERSNLSMLSVLLQKL